MKVLQVINSLSIGGAERLILDSIKYYKLENVDVEVLLLSDNDSVFRKEFEKEYPEIKINGLTKGSIYNPFLILKIIKYFRNVDIIHFHLFPALYWVVIAHSLCFSPARLIFTEHNTYNRRRDHFILKKLDQFIYSKVDYIGCITSSVKHELKKHLRNAKINMRIIHNGIGLEKFVNFKGDSDVLKSYRQSDDDVFIIQISNFKAQKDQSTLILSMKYLPKNYKLVLVGDGEKRQECSLLASELNLNDRIFFLGQRADVVELISASDIVVLSSHWEGFGLAIVEGMASGKPVIVSKVAGLSEIVEGYGLLFDKGNATELSSRILSLSDSQFYSEISLKCLVRSREFDIRSMVKSYIQLYEEVSNFR